VTAARTAPGQLRLRDAPPGLPDADLRPPTIAESGDPFAAARIAALVARLERGQPIRIADIVDRLNATYVDWLFTDRVVVDAILQLQTNWMADYRNASGSSSTTARTAQPSRSRTPVASIRGSSARSSARWWSAASGSTRSAGSTGPAARAEPVLVAHAGDHRVTCLCLRRARSR
jgi:hypothetical protein